LLFGLLKVIEGPLGVPQARVKEGEIVVVADFWLRLLPGKPLLPVAGRAVRMIGLEERAPRLPRLRRISAIQNFGLHAAFDSLFEPSCTDQALGKYVEWVRRAAGLHLRERLENFDRLLVLACH